MFTELVKAIEKLERTYCITPFVTPPTGITYNTHTLQFQRNLCAQIARNLSRLEFHAKQFVDVVCAKCGVHSTRNIVLQNWIRTVRGCVNWMTMALTFWLIVFHLSSSQLETAFFFFFGLALAEWSVCPGLEPIVIFPQSLYCSLWRYSEWGCWHSSSNNSGHHRASLIHSQFHCTQHTSKGHGHSLSATNMAWGWRPRATRKDAIASAPVSAVNELDDDKLEAAAHLMRKCSRLDVVW